MVCHSTTQMEGRFSTLTVKLAMPKCDKTRAGTRGIDFCAHTWVERAHSTFQTRLSLCFAARPVWGLRQNANYAQSRHTGVLRSIIHGTCRGSMCMHTAAFTAISRALYTTEWSSCADSDRTTPLRTVTLGFNVNVSCFNTTFGNGTISTLYSSIYYWYSGVSCENNHTYYHMSQEATS